MIKPEIKAAMDWYGKEGRPTGGFLRACLENDLLDATRRADEVNQLVLREIVAYIYYELPGQCHGSPEKVAKWLEDKRKVREELKKSAAIR